MDSGQNTGVTESERLLSRLCRDTFLTLWSYPNLFINKGDAVRGGDGKELCDLVVIFENHVILFSDKECQFGDSGNLDVDWSRWYRNAIKKSADQIFGAERWIRDYPGRIFTDRKCQTPLPIPLPDPSVMKFHRIVVAHGAAERCRRHLGGSGSLVLSSAVTGDAHVLKESDGGRPFTIGQVNPEKGFIHVYDDATLPMILKQLDTISDFVHYLDRKEKLFTSGITVIAAGEENMLAEFLKRTNEESEHDFIIPEGATGVAFDDGIWSEFQKNPQRLAQIEADEVSYTWDRIIEKFTFHALNGTSEWQSEPGLAIHEIALRFMAKEPRLRRRLLSAALMGLIHKTRIDQRATRIVKPYLPEQPYYLFLVMPEPPEAIASYEQYREVRRTLLGYYCMALKLDYPDATNIVGFATETGLSEARSEDLVYLDAGVWTDEDMEEAIKRKKELIELGLLAKRTATYSSIEEYPSSPASGKLSKVSSMMTGKNRNKPCPCGSGKKFKKCCGA